MKGLVLKNTGSWYQVKLEDCKVINCKLRGNFRLKGIKSTSPIVVGDYVEVLDLQEEGGAVITELYDRKNYMVRRSPNLSKQSHILAANLDQNILVVTVNYPETSTTFIDRFLASAEAYRVKTVLVFNKTDLYDEADLSYLDALRNLYQTIGYSCIALSATTGEGIDELKDQLKGKVSLFSGHSGVGKSTLINSLLPDAALKTGDISYHHNRGMHTTTFSEMVEIPTGGYLIDTPGIKGYGSFDMKKEEISHYFPEIFKFSKKCRYANCTHVHEPHCAVLDAIENHYISESRYTSYLSMLEDEDEGKYRAPY